MTKRADDQLPIISRPLLSGFQWFVAGYLARNFHTLAVQRPAVCGVCGGDLSPIAGMDCGCLVGPIGPADSIVVYANHASWWDPLAAIFIAQRLFANWALYAPIDAAALRQYPMFARMGFFGVEQHSPRGAAEFLRMADRILGRPATSLWMTPEGRFADVRDTTAELMPGLAHLAWKVASRNEPPPSPPEQSHEIPGGDRSDGADAHRVWFIPLAVEYTFWEERRPELLMRFGQPLCPSKMQPQSKQQWDRALTERLRSAQAELADLSVARDAAQFEILLGGSRGSFFVYDWWRRLCGMIRGRRVQIQHGQKFNQR